jgi:muramoyltetrapeptide carboxypeptidase
VSEPIRQHLIKPRALRAGSRLAVVSPASTPKAALVDAGIERLRGLGYDPVLYPSALVRGPLYYAGSVEERLRDLHSAFADPSIDGVICTRGGWGSAELLPYLDADLVRANPKVFVGYSDHTSLHAWFAREAGLVTFYAPMVASDFARENGVDLPSWNAALHGNERWVLGVNDGLRVLREGHAKGVLFGGCASIVAESLGTPYAMQAPAHDGILFVEDIGTKPYQWDRHLLHLRYGGLLERVKGVVFGDVEKCVDDEREAALLEAAILHNLHDFKGPIAIGLRCGHVHGANISLPLGVQAELVLGAEVELRMLESAVS